MLAGRESARSMMIAIKIISWKDAEQGRALEWSRKSRSNGNAA
jgi:hypothetical protein